MQFGTDASGSNAGKVRPFFADNTGVHTARRRSSGPGLILAAILWLAGVVAAVLVMSRYSVTPGASGGAPSTWPRESGIPLDETHPTLVLFAHPKCPCTRATIGELSLLMTRCQDRVSAHVLFIQPDGTAEDWTRTDLWTKAAAIPGVSVRADMHSTEARIFRAHTSGQALLYDTDGALLFQGGITAARGHSGDNAGRSGLVSLIEYRATSPIHTPVFGCPLDNESCTEADPAVCQ